MKSLNLVLSLVFSAQVFAQVGSSNNNPNKKMKWQGGLSLPTQFKLEVEKEKLGTGATAKVSDSLSCEWRGDLSPEMKKEGSQSSLYKAYHLLPNSQIEPSKSIPGYVCDGGSSASLAKKIFLAYRLANNKLMAHILFAPQADQLKAQAAFLKEFPNHFNLLGQVAQEAEVLKLFMTALDIGFLSTPAELQALGIVNRVQMTNASNALMVRSMQETELTLANNVFEFKVKMSSKSESNKIDCEYEYANKADGNDIITATEKLACIFADKSFFARFNPRNEKFLSVLKKSEVENDVWVSAMKKTLLESQDPSLLRADNVLRTYLNFQIDLSNEQALDISDSGIKLPIKVLFPIPFSNMKGKALELKALSK